MSAGAVLAVPPRDLNLSAGLAAEFLSRALDTGFSAMATLMFAHLFSPFMGLCSKIAAERQ
jgi:hypothetical protein